MHAPSALNPTHWYQWVVEAGGAAKTLYKAFNAIGSDAEGVLESLPWEDVPPP